MANTRQHQVHEQKLEQLVKSMPFYIVMRKIQFLRINGYL
jgi:hypothetical protein